MPVVLYSTNLIVIFDILNLPLLKRLWNIGSNFFFSSSNSISGQPAQVYFLLMGSLPDIGYLPVTSCSCKVSRKSLSAMVWRPQCHMSVLFSSFPSHLFDASKNLPRMLLCSKGWLSHLSTDLPQKFPQPHDLKLFLCSVFDFIPPWLSRVNTGHVLWCPFGCRLAVLGRQI